MIRLGLLRGLRFVAFRLVVIACAPASDRSRRATCRLRLAAAAEAFFFAVLDLVGLFLGFRFGLRFGLRFGFLFRFGFRLEVDRFLGLRFGLRFGFRFEAERFLGLLALRRLRDLDFTGLGLRPATEVDFL